MLRTRICELLGIEHPIVLGGMGTGTSPALVAAVSEAGGLGVLGATQHGPAEMAREAAAIRALTARPFGLNLLLFRERPEQYDGLLAARPSVVSTAWPSIDQDLAGYVSRAHAVGARFMHMVSTVAEAKAAARAGVDVIVAQGTEGGGHVGVMGTMPLVPMVVSAALRAAAKAGDPDRGAIMLGQTAGLIDRVEPAADLVRQISRDAEAILRERLPRLLA